MPNCPACGAPLETPVACGACGTIHAVSETASPFEILGLRPGFELEGSELRRRSTRFSRLVHPDFFAGADPAVRERAERNSARLNQAFDVLADAQKRADWLVVHLGGPTEESERSMPQAFLMEVLEWNELLEEVRASGAADPRLAGLAADLAQRRAQGLERLARLLQPLPARGAPELVAARSELNALRYLDRALREIESLRLDRAERR